MPWCRKRPTEWNLLAGKAVFEIWENPWKSLNIFIFLLNTLSRQLSPYYSLGQDLMALEATAFGRFRVWGQIYAGYCQKSLSTMICRNQIMYLCTVLTVYIETDFPRWRGLPKERRVIGCPDWHLYINKVERKVETAKKLNWFGYWSISDQNNATSIEKLTDLSRNTLSPSDSTHIAHKASLRPPSYFPHHSLLIFEISPKTQLSIAGPTPVTSYWLKLSFTSSFC